MSEVCTACNGNKTNKVWFNESGAVVADAQEGELVFFKLLPCWICDGSGSESCANPEIDPLRYSKAPSINSRVLSEKVGSDPLSREAWKEKLELWETIQRGIYSGKLQ